MSMDQEYNYYVGLGLTGTLNDMRAKYYATDGAGVVRGEVDPVTGGSTLSVDLAKEKSIVKKSRFRGLSVVSGSKQNLTGPSKGSVASGTYDTTRIRHKNLTGKPLSHLALVFANFGPSSGTEAASANAISVQAAIENMSPSGANTQDQPRQPVESLNGSVSVYDPLTISRRGVLASKDVPHYVDVDGEFFTRVGVTPSSGTGSFPRGGCCFGGTTNWGIDNGEGSTASQNYVADGATAINANATSYYYSESAVLGRCYDGSIATSVAICGDSIADGVDDAGYGGPYVGGVELRLFANTPRIRLSIPGERLGNIFSANGPTSSFYSRGQLLALTTHVTSGYGRNDVEQYATYGTTVAGALTLFKTNLLAFAKHCMQRGQHFAQLTILPSPTSTDGWYTTANQTPQAGDKELLRVAINAWLTDTTASGFVSQANAQVASVLFPGQAKVIDRCAPIECNQSGALTVGGGCILGSQSAVEATGTATAATSTSVTLGSASWATNAYKGHGLYIESGTGAGQMRCIAYNSGTVLTVNNAFSTTPDTTSVFKVYKALGMNGVHPISTLHDIVSADAGVVAATAAFLELD